ncbi:hypothetical protein IHE49_13095 [Rhodanobacter sp. 7MK24]|uniref:hypothetical protein n=1 Tax=Rhodanobacter sp. 7MK24 TaxID=2775922 RepID=UPI00177C840F|nr:hypothetical protein [Rhodanobacter sp. 7MK24]MBD8881418.1 hypothetical protein [Rhodanobacter sp. 7MK24]
MHIEPPNTRLGSFRDFAKHYLMIVLSILTALGLEAWIEHTHHARAAEEASQHIRTELLANLADIRKSIKTNEGLIAPLQHLDETLTVDIRDNLPAAAINQHIQAQKDAFRLSINWPTFASQSWDVAVANQSASWIDDARLRHYSRAYADLRETSDWVSHDGIALLDVPAMERLHTRVDLGAPVDPLEFISTVRQMLHTSMETQSHLHQLESHLLYALGKDADDDTAAGHAASP